MLGKTHFAVGIAVGLIVGQPKTIPALLAGIGVSALGGVLPDIDSGTSTAHKDADRTGRCKFVLRQSEVDNHLGYAAAAVHHLAGCPIGDKRNAAGLDDGSYCHLVGKCIDLLGKGGVAGVGLIGFAAGVRGLHGEFLVEGVERVDLLYITAHDASQGAEFFLVLAHLCTVRGLGLLYTLHQLCDFLLGGVELCIHGIVFSGE